MFDRARREIARFYPTYADFEPLDLKNLKPYEKQAIRLVPLKDDGKADVDDMNAVFSTEYLTDKRNPRWVAKPTVAYLWARTVQCKNCRAAIPLLKTRWLCKKETKRVLLTMVPNPDKTSMVFDIERNVPVKGGNTAQRREHDKRIGFGTMSRSGAKCPCCPAIMTMEDIRLEGQAGRLGVVNTAVVVDGRNGKEYRLPTLHEIQLTYETERFVSNAFSNIPFGIPSEQLPSKEALGFRVPLYGIDQWNKLFSSRQLLALGTFVNCTRAAKEAMNELSYPNSWLESVIAYLALAIDRMANRGSCLCIWNMPAEKIEQTFARFALPILWDFAESNPLATASGNYQGEIEWVQLVCQHVSNASPTDILADSLNQSAIGIGNIKADIIVTDPPYYDAIPYSDLMDFFYVWLRRATHGLTPEIDAAFNLELSPKWNHSVKDGELIDDSSRHNGDAFLSKTTYEDGMFRAFQACNSALDIHGRLVIVFAHKQPDAWETLVSAMIRAGFVVDSSWPIQTERSGRMRANASAALSSSVWLVCKKRSDASRPGWDNQVLEDMTRNIRAKLRDFWDAGIRGPDFVWAGTGPALEAYSKHPVVKKANDPGQLMAVSEFLTHVRRIVVDFVVGRVLAGEQENTDDLALAERLDEPTAYYLLHRNDFHLDEAPAGACILYAISCGVSDRELADTWNIISFTKGKSADEGDHEEADADAEADADIEEESGSKVKLKTWAQRKSSALGYEASGGKAVPLIDRVHCLMHLWKAGELSKVGI